jgi:5-methyltetrahydropteroyltriglutamate--homocysteine methyltransferase
MPLEELRRIEDQAIIEVIALQQQVGIDVISDGEFRRSGWSSEFAEAVTGYVPGKPPVALEWHDAGVIPDNRPQVQMGGAGRIIGERLRPARRITAHEAGFVKQHAGGKPYKVTMPAASYLVTRGYVPGVTDKVYADRKEVLKDVAGLINAEIKALIADGVPYIQLDNPHYPDYVDAGRQAQWKAMGVDPAQALNDDIEADNACLAGLNRSNVTMAMHLCRGNGARGAWHTRGGYDAIAERVFGAIDVDAFLLEYDSERAGTFEPLRFVPKNKTVVLGLITTKAGALEPQDLLIKRIQEASAFLPLENLTLSPQCGFASTMQGNPLTADEQRKKLELVVSTARKVWG